jgi:hypothetical protein
VSSPGAVRALGGVTKRDAPRVHQQMVNPAYDYLVGVAHPFALMHERSSQDDFGIERLHEAPSIARLHKGIPGLDRQDFRGG